MNDLRALESTISDACARLIPLLGQGYGSNIDRLIDALDRNTEAVLASNARGQAEPVKEPDAEWSEWIEWGGGERPVPAETDVCVRFRSGYIDDELDAGNLSWRHIDDSGDIIAYRVRKGGEG